MLDYTAIPGPSPYPILGWRGNNIRFIMDRVGYISMLHQRYGVITTFATQNPENWFFAFGPEYNQLLLSNTELYNHIQPINLPGNTAAARLSTGLLSLNGQEHAAHRSLLMPFFQRKYIDSYIPEIVEITNKHLARLAIGKTVDLESFFKQLVFHIACKTLFGIDFNEIGESLRLWLSRLTSTSIALLPHINFPFSPFRRFEHLSRGIKKSILDIIAEKQNLQSDSPDIVNLLIKSGLSNYEIIGELMTLLLASHETTSAALSWIFFLLSQSPDITNKLTDEISGSKLENLNQLNLLDNIVKESLRLFPPVPYQHRRATDSYQLGPYMMPKNSIVSYSPYITHRLPNLYEHPTHFLPSRWNTIKPTTYEFLPFGAGPRMCIGASLAIMQIKIIIYLALQQFSMVLQPNVRMDRRTNIVLTQRYGLPMSIVAPYKTVKQLSRIGNIWDMVYFPE